MNTIPNGGKGDESLGLRIQQLTYENQGLRRESFDLKDRLEQAEVDIHAIQEVVQARDWQIEKLKADKLALQEQLTRMRATMQKFQSSKEVITPFKEQGSLRVFAEQTPRQQAIRQVERMIGSSVPGSEPHVIHRLESLFYFIGPAMDQAGSQCSMDEFVAASKDPNMEEIRRFFALAKEPLTTIFDLKEFSLTELEQKIHNYRMQNNMMDWPVQSFNFKHLNLG